MLKKVLTVGLPLIALIIAIMVFRANTVYQNNQLQGGDTINLPIDKPLALQRLSQAIKIPTISYDDASRLDSKAFNQFHQHLAVSFPLIEQKAKKTLISQHSLIFHLAGQDTQLKPVLFLAHMDVVPVDDHSLGQWTHPPFSGKQTKDSIWGRGTMDDKGGLMALLEAVELHLSQNKPLKRDIYLAFGHDEEVGGAMGAAKIAQHFKAQGISFDFVLDEGGAVTQGMMQGIDNPVALVGVAEKGFVNVHLSVDAQGGHSSQPPPHTAVGILSQAIVNIEQNPFKPSLEFTRMTFDAIGYQAAFGSRLAMANLWLTAPLVKSTLMAQPKLAASLHTTMAATMVKGSAKSNILPTLATAVVNVRIFPGQSEQSVSQYIKQAINDSRVKLHTSMVSAPSPVSSINGRGFKLISQSIRHIDNNILVAPYLVQGGTDSKYFYPVADNVYRFLMVRVNKQTLNRLHGINEQIKIDDYFNTITFYYQILDQL